MSFQQVIAGKVKLNGLGGIRRHMQERDRVKTNPNIDLMRSHLNYCIEGLTPDSLNHRVNERIKQLNLKKKPRSDAVGLEDIIISASVDFMLNLDPQTRENYFRDSLHFIQYRYGKENVMYCQCHMDESNPHIHIGVIPITSDGRLSAKSLFSPKTLEKLQTDFHNAVSVKYGLERGLSHSKKYLPIQQFKAQQAKLQAEKFTNIVDSAKLEFQKIKNADKSAHHPSNGIIFTSEDNKHIQLPTNDYVYLKEAAEEGTRAVVRIHSLEDDIQHLKRDNYLYKSDANLFAHELHQLEKETKPYADVPKSWRKNIDVEILKLQKLFTQYCHNVNYTTAKVFIKNNCDYAKTINAMQSYFKNIGVKDYQKFIHHSFYAAKHQFVNHSRPEIPPPSWQPPKPEQTDYTIPDVEDNIIAPDLVQLGGDSINWDMLNWNLLTNIEKKAIKMKLMFRELC